MLNEPNPTVFYSAKGTDYWQWPTVIDIVVQPIGDGERLGLYSGETEAALREKYSDLIVCSHRQAIKDQSDRYIKPVKEVDIAHWERLRDCLPPIMCGKGHGGISFRICEAIVDDVRTIMVRTDDHRFFELADRDTLSHRDVMTKVEAFKIGQEMPA